MLPRPFTSRPYLLIVSNLYCNHRCSYCIQQESSLDVRRNPKRVDVSAVLEFLRRNRIARSVKVMGGEATLHPEFGRLMDGLLGLYRKVVVTTNLHGTWYTNFDAALATMSSWGSGVVWNTTYHPAWMDADLYVSRVRAMQAAGLQIGQVTTTQSPDLDLQTARRLHAADIGWRLQPFLGRLPDGRLVPQTWDDILGEFPALYSPAKFIEHYDAYATECVDANQQESHERNEWVHCVTSRFLIGPDGNVYPCHRHLYAEDSRYACGNVREPQMSTWRIRWNHVLSRWSLPCSTKCNPCDFRSVKITPTGRANPAAPAAASCR